MEDRRVSLGRRLRSSGALSALGVRPNWDDYPPASREAIRHALKIYYASPIYEDLAISLGKDVFPRNYYRFMGNKIRQTNLFQLLGISHPRTHLYYGRNLEKRIKMDFEYPFMAKDPVGSSKGEGVFLVRSDESLQAYLDRYNPAYIQEYLPIDRDLRVVLVGGEVVHSYWRIQQSGEFRNNVARGAVISYEDIPADALTFAVKVAGLCRFDEVGLDICQAHGEYYVIEANMVYGLAGFRQIGLDIYEVLARMEWEGII